MTEQLTITFRPWETAPKDGTFFQAIFKSTTDDAPCNWKTFRCHWNGHDYNIVAPELDQGSWPDYLKIDGNFVMPLYWDYE